MGGGGAGGSSGGGGSDGGGLSGDGGAEGGSGSLRLGGSEGGVRGEGGKLGAEEAMAARSSAVEPTARLPGLTGGSSGAGENGGGGAAGGGAEGVGGRSGLIEARQQPSQSQPKKLRASHAKDSLSAPQLSLRPQGRAHGSSAPTRAIWQIRSERVTRGRGGI